MKYMPRAILVYYREFERRADALSKPDEVGKCWLIQVPSILYGLRYKVELESFSRQMMNICPTLSRSSVEAGLRELIVKSDSGSAQAD